MRYILDAPAGAPETIVGIVGEGLYVRQWVGHESVIVYDVHRPSP